MQIKLFSETDFLVETFFYWKNAKAWKNLSGQKLNFCLNNRRITKLPSVLKRDEFPIPIRFRVDFYQSLYVPIPSFIFSIHFVIKLNKSRKNYYKDFFINSSKNNFCYDSHDNLPQRTIKKHSGPNQISIPSRTHCRLTLMTDLIFLSS